MVAAGLCARRDCLRVTNWFPACAGKTHGLRGNNTSLRHLYKRLHTKKRKRRELDSAAIVFPSL
jgi:hypothetical protein